MGFIQENERKRLLKHWQEYSAELKDLQSLGFWTLGLMTCGLLGNLYCSFCSFEGFNFCFVCICTIIFAYRFYCCYKSEVVKADGQFDRNRELTIESMNEQIIVEQEKISFDLLWRCDVLRSLQRILLPTAVLYCIVSLILSLSVAHSINYFIPSGILYLICWFLLDNVIDVFNIDGTKDAYIDWCKKNNIPYDLPCCRTDAKEKKKASFH